MGRSSDDETSNKRPRLSKADSEPEIIDISSDDETELQADDVGNDQDWIELFKEEEKLAQEAGEDLAAVDGTAAALDTESDDAIRKWIHSGWQSVAEIKTVEEVQDILDYFHASILAFAKTHFLQHPSEHYAFAKTAFRHSSGGPATPWRSRSSVAVLEEMAYFEIGERTIRMSLHHAKAVIMTVIMANCDRAMKRHIKTHGTPALPLDHLDRTIPYDSDTHERGVYVWSVNNKVLIGMTYSFSNRRQGYARASRKGTLSARVRDETKITPFSEWQFDILFDRGPKVPLACIYSFESDNIILTATAARLNTRLIDNARLSCVLSISQVRRLYELCVEWATSGKRMPSMRDTLGWSSLIGDQLGSKEAIQPETLWNAIFGHTWKFVDDMDRKLRTFVWKPEHFKGGKVPVRLLTAAQRKEIEAERASAPASAKNTVPKYVNKPKPKNKANNDLFSSSAFLNMVAKH